MSLKVGVVGAGAMGTALSQIIVENTDELLLYARRNEICEAINQTKYNPDYYPNIELSSDIHAVNDLNELSNCDVIFLCIPSSTMRETVEKLNNIISDDCILVSLAKGLEYGTNKRMSEIIEDIIKRPAVVLSGPNIASEMVKKLFTTTTIASTNKKYLNKVYNTLSIDKFKINRNADVIGTEYCGVIKNILAISQGIFEGMNINDNARFAIFTESYLEVKEIIERLGGLKDTVDDYCGFGDIIAASTLNVSRNHTLGVLRGQNLIIDEKASGVLFEGKNTAIILKEICDNLNIKALTVNFVYEIIIENKNPNESFMKLWDQIGGKFL